jgi:hypothetical protein
VQPITRQVHASRPQTPVARGEQTGAAGPHAAR